MKNYQTAFNYGEEGGGGRGERRVGRGMGRRKRSSKRVFKTVVIKLWSQGFFIFLKRIEAPKRDFLHVV